MNVNQLLESYMHWLQPIIQGLFVGILALIFVLLFFSLRKKKPDEAQSSTSIEGLESTLKKVIESTQHLSAPKEEEGAKDSSAASAPGVAAAAGVAAASGAVAAASSEEILKLQAELAAKEKKLTEVLGKMGELEKSQATSATPDAATSAGGRAAAAVDTTAFEARIKDLEARLQEYEIIEDDIANLSLYKEENIRLKNELSKLSGGKIPPPEVPPELVETKGESLETALQAAGGMPEVEVPQPATSGAPAEDAAPTDDLVGQLSSLVEGKAGEAPAEQKAQAQEAAPPAAPEPKTEESSTAAAPQETAPKEEVPEPLKGFDPDKIAEEAANLKPDEQAASTESTENEADIGQKLIDEFENFMKES